MGMILKGDCISIMKAMKPNSVDAIVTDPPYGLEFMGKEWDKLISKRDGFDNFGQNTESGRHGGRSNPFIQSRIDKYQVGLQAQLWHTQWLTKAYRVLKPGGSMLVMGGTRTSHRLACAIEDSGFIIKDTLMWIYGSGFPKAQDLGKMIKKRGGNGKHWDGFKVGGIKPAYEPIIWAVKPPEGSYVDNVLKHGVGAVNVDECRVGINGNNKHSATSGYEHKSPFHLGKSKKIKTDNSKGRFPANVILSHHPECVQVGMKKVKGTAPIGKPSIGKPAKLNRVGSSMNVHPNPQYYNDSDGLETIESWDCHPDCAVRLLDEQSGNLSQVGGAKKTTHKDGMFGIGQPGQVYFDGNAGASRFFYCAKASRGERNAGLEGMEEKPVHWSSGHQNPGSFQAKGTKKEMTNHHPTVKPIKLFEWLIKLVTREGQIVLDPFIGSGTTAIAAHNVGRRCIGIEKEDEYLEIAKRRIDYWKSQPKQMELR